MRDISIFGVYGNERLSCGRPPIWSQTNSKRGIKQAVMLFVPDANAQLCN